MPSWRSGTFPIHSSPRRQGRGPAAEEITDPGLVPYDCAGLPLFLYRGIAYLTPGWKTASLPLSNMNDDKTAPFPMDASSLSMAGDPILTTAPLTLYRLLQSVTDDTGNRLRVAKKPGSVEIRF